MLPNISGGHTAYQNFVVTNLRKYYPNPDALAPSTWDIIERFWNLDLSYTDELIIIFLPTSILLRKKLKSLKQKEPKQIPWKKSRLPNCFPSLKIRNST